MPAELEPGAKGGAESAYHSGVRCSREGDWRAAIEAFEIATFQSDDDALRRIARLDLAEVLMKSGAPAAGLEHFKRLLDEGVPVTVSRLHVLLRTVACQLAAGETPSDIELPHAGEEISEATAGAWFEAAYSFEASNDLSAAVNLYERLLDRPGLSAWLVANTRFRCGYVSEVRLDWRASVECYEKCVDAPRVYPFAQDLARWHLANLLYASEEYDRAARHYEILKLADTLSAEQQAQARLRHARALLGGGSSEAGERELLNCRRLYPESDVGIQADLLLADIYSEREDHGAAMDCYRRVIRHPYAESSVKALAQMCMVQLPRT